MTDTLTVKWFSEAKGFGFVSDEFGDVYLHKSRLKLAGFAKLIPEPGMKLEADTVVDDEGRRRVTVIHSLDGKKSRRPGKKAGGQKASTNKSRRSRTLSVGTSVVAEVIMYERGFGFVRILGAGNEDVENAYFHITQVPDECRDYVVKGAIFDVRIGENERGQVALIQSVHVGEFMEFTDSDLAELSAMPNQLDDEQAA